MKRKILYLNHAAYLGGAEIALLNLLTYIDRSRYDPVVLAPESELTRALTALSIRCVPIPVLDGLNRYTLPDFVKQLPRLARLIRQEAPALIHANTNFSSEYAGVLGKWLHVPTIGQIRDIEPFGRIGCWLVRQNTWIVSISTAVTSYLLAERIPTHAIVRIYDGVDLQQYRVPPLSEGQRTGMIIGLIGQIGARKGHLYFLHAARDLVQNFPDLQFWIVGQEPRHSREGYTTQLQQYVREHQLEPYVRFWGFRTDIPDILAQLDILVVPSLQEPFGKIVIEGMAMAKPVVASRVGGIPEIVADGQTGILTPPGETQALYEALSDLIQHPEKRVQIGIAGRARVEQQFSLESTVTQTEDLYARILQEQDTSAIVRH